MINVGTAENPVFADVSGDTQEGKHFWSSVASGSSTVPDGKLDELLNASDEQNP
jgi:hypothetical protein